MAFEMPNKWPLVTNIQSRDSASNSTVNPTSNVDARLVNCFAERQEDGSYIVEKRPGCVHAGYPVISGTDRGVYRFGTNTYWVTSGSLYQNGLVAGPVNNNLFYRWQEVNSTPRVLVTGNTLEAYVIDAGVVTNIVDPDFIYNLANTTPAWGWAYLDGTLYAMATDCRIQGSDINNPLAWSALNFITANGEPGDGVAIAKHLSYVLAMKTANVEVFYNAGNPTGSPLSRVQGATIPMGCASGPSVAEIDGMLFWVAYNRNNELRVVKLDNLNLQVVSTPSVNRLLSSIEAPGPNFRGFTIKICGHRFYVLKPGGFITLNFALVYDIDQNLWYEWTNEAFSVGTPWQFGAASFQDRDVIGQASDGQIYYIRPDYIYGADIGAPFTVDIYTPNFDAGVFSRKKMLSQMVIEADRRPGMLQVRHNDHDYDPAKWTNFVNVNLDSRSPRLGPQGSFYRRAYNFRHRSMNPFRIKNVHLQMAMGTL